MWTCRYVVTHIRHHPAREPNKEHLARHAEWVRPDISRSRGIRATQRIQHRREFWMTATPPIVRRRFRTIGTVTVYPDYKLR